MSAALQAASLQNPQKIIHKFGYSPAVGTSEEDIWDYGGVYTFLSAPSILYVSCGAAATNEITVIGLDADWKAQTQTVTLNGQAQKAIPGTWLRVFRAYNSSGTDLPGNVWIAESDTLTAGEPDTASKVKALIDADAQQTLMAIYTIPADKRAYLVNLRWSIASTKTATFKFYVREPGGVFRLRDIYVGVGEVLDIPYPIWITIPPKSDLKMSAIAGAINTEISATFDLLLVNETA